jgi:MFS family permease
MGTYPFHRLKVVYLGLEAMNSLGVGLYYTYLFWFMQTRFGFDDSHNLALAAVNGLVYTACAWQGGRFGQRYGYLTALTAGAWIMMTGLAGAIAVDLLSAAPHPALIQSAIMIFWTFGVSLTWPALEAMVSDHEPPQNLPRMVGRYNVTWATGWAIAYFAGGAMLEHLGARSVFVIPLAIHFLQIGAILWVKPRTGEALGQQLQARDSELGRGETATPLVEPGSSNPRAKLFLRLAWIANPFAYLAITALVPVIPGLAAKHGLSPTSAGIFCSVWFFARLAAFFLLWHWPAWHYRFRWLLGANVLLIISFGGILLSPSLWPIFFFQILFGLSVGLIYYSSLYYSMDAGDEKGAHGGIHEAAIGAGLFAGPAIGFLALLLFPQNPQADTWAVSAALAVGVIALVHVRRRASSAQRLPA